MDKGDFKGFSLDEGTSVEIIQFTYDTLIIRGGGWKNLWSIKFIFRGFDLVSGLRVSFHKSILIGINVSKYFLIAASNFLSCKIEESNFNFLGIPIDSNPRRIKTYSHIIDKFKSKLALWRGGYLSFADIIIVINSIFTRLPIFFFLFYKAPVKVWRDIDKIWQRFPWGGTNVKSKIHWVRWDNVCKSKEFGGLGIKSIEEFNLAPLSKWKWRILVEKNALWKRVLKLYMEVLRIRS